MKLLKPSFVCLCVSLVSSALAAPVNLSSWTAEGSGTWQLQNAPTNDSVLQTVNTVAPTVFFSGAAAQGAALSGKIKVSTTSDDDFIGFVLGYNAGELTSASANYLLIDWKQASQVNGNCNGPAGLAISSVSGAMTTTGAWCHNGSVTQLQRAATLGSTGWVDNTEYTFDIAFTSTNVTVSVNGVEQLNVNGTFGDGGFGFYNYSQERVLYSAIEERQLPPNNQVPEPAGLALLGLAGLAAAASARFVHSKRV